MTTSAEKARKRRQTAALNRVVKFAGSQQAVGDWFGISAQAVQGWLARGLPFDYVTTLERRTGGEVQAWELCEDYDERVARPYGRPRPQDWPP